MFSATKAGMEQYVLNEAGLSWTSAQAFCRTSYTDLTSVRNEVEAAMIHSLLGGMEVWVGLFRDPWVWSDQADSSLRFWPADQQVWSEDVQDCGALLKTESGRWGGRNCSEQHPFFCSCKNTDTKRTYIKVKINLKDSALDLNNSVVQNNILKQMKLKQKEDGITVMQTQWRKQPNGKIFVKEAPDDD
ncbi:C-type lectin domain family 4 member K [Austrofundulus limnaeus]|uniref:C-type lectin domain family 4 member K n=1 Tax=Austrofundulus limnaeus TaxID=52670 RepID=A0A2I4CUU2_AUSLI|nr:PREDICTED: C-type lectin domain family 4 member K-like [Austrofundulus limnaeus]